ncbi:MAG: AmmeMemoRadiSam system protein B [Planctomycetota bacterium]|jgi:hypothetical protein
MPEQSSNLMRGPIRLRQGILLLCVLGLFPVISCRKETPAPEQEALEPQAKAISEPMPKSVLRSQLARVGWYTARPDALNRQIDSGSIAAKGLKTTDRKYKRIVVIGPSHSVPMEEILSVPRVTHYETPLGEVPLDVEFINKLLEYSVFRNVPQAHEFLSQCSTGARVGAPRPGTQRPDRTAAVAAQPDRFQIRAYCRRAMFA